MSDETASAELEQPAMALSREDFWKALGSPKYILGPMVDQSELPFRLLTRRYGAQLAYTPMLHSRLFAEDVRYRERNFSTCDDDRPLIAQFCGDNPDILGRAAELIAPHVDAVDINFGCPQGIAKRGHYGAFLLSDPDLVESIVRGTVERSPVPVTCKIRKIPGHDAQETVNLARRLEDAGCAALCLHGRTIVEKGQHVKAADWNVIAATKKALRIPVIANGGVSSLEEADLCLLATGADAVMSAEAILEYPALFHKTAVDQDTLIAEYIDLAERYKTPNAVVKAHLFHSLYAGLQVHTDLRSQLAQAKSVPEFRSVVETLSERRRDMVLADKLGWYFRYRTPIRSGTLDALSCKRVKLS